MVTLTSQADPIEKHQFYHDPLNSAVEGPESKDYDAKIKAELMSFRICVLMSSVKLMAILAIDLEDLDLNETGNVNGVLDLLNVGEISNQSIYGERDLEFLKDVEEIHGQSQGQIKGG